MPAMLYQLFTTVTTVASYRVGWQPKLFLGKEV